MTTLVQAEALELLPALVAAVAESLGARALLIKGAVATHHGLRGPRLSDDIDFLVEPSRFDDVLSRLGELGWAPPGGPLPGIFERPHSLAVQHELWPVELDVHSYFPGFFADDQAAFDALWEDRVDLPVGGVDIPAAGLSGSVVIAALHALRVPDMPRHVAEFDQLTAWLADVAGAETIASVVSMIEATGSAAPLVPLMPHLGTEVEAVTSAGDPRMAEWRLHAAKGEVRAVSWIQELRRQPWWLWPMAILRALLGASEWDLRKNYPEAPPGRRGTWLARWWRLRDVVPQLPKAIALVWRHR